MDIQLLLPKHHPNLFEFQKAAVVFPHDRLLDKTILRLIPHWITPNHITTVRIIGIPFVIQLMLSHAYLSAVVLFLLLAITDAMDGSLARTRAKITEFGKLYDPLADKLLIGTMVVLLVFRNFSPLLAAAVVGIEIVFIVIAIVAKIKFHSVQGANIWGKVKMIAQVIAVALTLFALIWQIPQLLTLAAIVFSIAIVFAIVSLFAHGI